MTLTTIAQPLFQFQAQAQQFVLEYSFTVFNSQTDDTQELTASFVGVPTQNKWQEWLKGWNSIGYELSSDPQIIGIF